MRYTIRCVMWQSPNEVWSIVESREYCAMKGHALDLGDLYIMHKTGTMYYPRRTLDGWTAYSNNYSRKVPAYVFEAWEELYVVPSGFSDEKRVMTFRDVQAKWNSEQADRLQKEYDVRVARSKQQAEQEQKTLEQARTFIDSLSDGIVKNTLRHYCDILPEWYRLKYPERTESWAQGAVKWRAGELASAAWSLMWQELEDYERREEVD